MIKCIPVIVTLSDFARKQRFALCEISDGFLVHISGLYLCGKQGYNGAENESEMRTYEYIGILGCDECPASDHPDDPAGLWAETEGIFVGRFSEKRKLGDILYLLPGHVIY